MTPTKKPAKSRKRRPAGRKPRVLVLEGLRDAASCIRAAGAEAITANPRDPDAVDTAIAVGFDAILLTGGGDVNPELYGEKPHRRVYGVNEIRDYVEWIALDHAEKHGLPVLGICRGMQLMAVHNGGRLKQHVEGHRNTTHIVVSERGSTYRRIVGSAGMFVSLHHQRVLRTGPGWRVAGRDRQGGIEAVESRDGRCLGVQFHPEMDHWRNPQSRQLFRWLVAEAATRAGLAIPAAQEPIVRKLPERPVHEQLSLVPRRRVRSVGTTRWFCRDCGMEFDKQQDRDDHEYWICGEPKMRTTEPPPGHPDWMPEDAA